MDINARINWMPGMELTDQTFKELEENLDFRQRVAVRAALGGSRLGLLPGAEFDCRGVFVKNNFEIERFLCSAVLPSGTIVTADEKVVIAVPMLFGAQYYLTVGLGEETHSFEKEGVPYVCPQKAYAIRSLDEMQKEDVLPVARFKVSDGVFSLDTDFIPPSLLLSSDKRFMDYGTSYASKLQALVEHKNLEEGEGKRALLRYLFQLKSYPWNGGVREFIQFTQEIAQAVDYYIVTPHTENPVAVPVPTQYDVQLWLEWLSGYLGGAHSILDTVVLEDNTIDYEALLAQAKAELYDRLNPELRADLLRQIKEELRAELKEDLSGSLTAFINEEVKPRLHDTLSGELDPSLHERLYNELYDALYNALYVPEEEEETFYPLL
ncbi:MAG: hypothetical protein ILP18_10060 [Treponema sp.]|nr:hypothetical protein [Treponema sp.]